MSRRQVDYPILKISKKQEISKLLHLSRKKLNFGKRLLSYIRRSVSLNISPNDLCHTLVEIFVIG